MIRLREALRSSRSDEGFSLVEVIVAMVVFGIVSTGVLTSANIVVRMTADNRSRQIATNLAEQQLDEDRGTLDPFNIHNIPASPTDAPLTRTVSGRVYTTTQVTSLVSVDGSDITCGSSKTVSYRRITVKVDWTGRLPTTDPVQSDTVLAPNGRINDSSTGSIAVLVSGVTGTGESGVSVSVTPVSSTATALLSQPAATDIDGCTYAFGVTPGTYRVSISKTSSVDQLQNATPTTNQANEPADLVVTAGATSPLTFSYDQTATYPLTYAPGANAALPDAMATTFLSTGPPYSSDAGSAPLPKATLYPYPSGYGVIAGRQADPNTKSLCAAEDPAAWGSATGVKSAVRGAAPGVQPGSTASSVAVPMGIFTVTAPLLGNTYVTAVGQSSTVNGQPGCQSTETFRFSSYVLPGQTKTFALPYGTYQLNAGGTLGLTNSPIGSPAVKIASSAYNGPLSSITSGGLLTLDPRPAS
jgi:prepilin-type N-terminal cleavage/methylation domain-containing protein